MTTRWKQSEQWLWQNTELLQWWLDLQSMAASEDTDVLVSYKLYHLRRGQFFASVRSLQDRWAKRNRYGKIIKKPGERRVLSFLRLLQERGMIKRDFLDRQVTVVTICSDNTSDNTCDNTSDNTENPTILDTRDTKSAPAQRSINNYLFGNNIKPSSLRSDGMSEPSSDAFGAKRVCACVKEFFNSEMEACGAKIPRIRSLTGQRKAFLEARLKEFGEDAVREAIGKAARSDFLNGHGSRAFIADFTWIMRPNNFPRVLEGSFDNRNDKPNKQTNDGVYKQSDKVQRRVLEVTATSAEDFKTTF